MNQTESTLSVEAVVEACTLYWMGRGIPRPTVDEMRAEFRDHLQAARKDGKSIRAVTGDDLQTFAAAWSESYQQPAALPTRLLNWLSTAAWIIAGVALFKHLYGQQFTVSIYWSDIAVVLLLLGTLPLFYHLTFGWLAPLSAKRWQRAEVIGAAAGVGLVGLLAVATAVFQQSAPSPLIAWPWWLTTATLILASVLTGAALHMDSTRLRIHASSYLRRRAGRWALFGMLALIIGTALSFLAMPETARRIVPVWLILLGASTLWLWFLHRLTIRQTSA